MNQIALNTDLVTPATDVVTRDAAVEYEMKLVSQAVERSLRDQVTVRRAPPSTSVCYYLRLFLLPYRVV